MDRMTFSCRTHVEAGLRSARCHNPQMFPRQKRGAVSRRMAEIYPGMHRGKCHGGKTGFKAIGDCGSCPKRWLWRLRRQSIAVNHHGLGWFEY